MCFPTSTGSFAFAPYTPSQANIFISDSDEPVIGDFGLSELEEKDPDDRYSTAFYNGGSLRWQAPELVNASSPEEAQRTRATDVFAFGRVMLEVSRNDDDSAALPLTE